MRPNKPPYGDPPGKGRKWWNSLTAQSRIEILTPYFENNWTNKELKNFLGLTIGRIARVRDNRNTELKAKAAESPPRSGPKPAERATKRKVARVPAPEPQTTEPPEAPAPALAPVQVKPERVYTGRVSRTLAATESTQCRHRDNERYQCGYERLPDSESCGRPGHDK